MRRYSDKIFHIFNTLLMLGLLVIFVWPLWFVLIASFSDPNKVSSGQVLLIPKGITLGGYELMLKYKSVLIGYKNSISYTFVGTLASLFFSICLAYPMSDKSFAPRKYLMIIFMISMYFGGGVIPTYLLLRGLKIINTYWAMILPGMISVSNSLIIRSYFMNSIPGELKEASTLDGANSAQYLIKVVLPLSKPVMAVIGLYYAVSYWNNYTKALYYIYDSEKYPLQMVLRSLLTASKLVDELTYDPEYVETVLQQAQLMKYSTIILASVPMLCVYPFIQRYFIKGVMVGAVKG